MLFKLREIVHVCKHKIVTISELLNKMSREILRAF